MRDIDILILVVASVAARLGYALMASGGGRAKFAAAAVVRVLLDFSVVLLTLVLVRRTGWIGFGADSPTPPNAPLTSLITPLAGALLATGSIALAVGERCTTRAVVAAAALYALVVLPLSGHTVAMLTERGFIDDGGASLFHLTAGVIAVVAALVVGPRAGRFDRDGSIAIFPGHQLPQSLFGLLLFALAFIPITAQLAGAAGPASIRLLVAAAAGVIATALYSHLRFARIGPALLIPGVIGALVSAAASAGRASDWQAVLAGATGAIAAVVLHLLLERKVKLDEVVPVATAQIAGATTGLLLAGLFATLRASSLPGSSPPLIQSLAAQILGLSTFATLALFPATLLLLPLKKLTPLRTPDQSQYDGLDLTNHDLNAYPDFSQPTIRSYHNREV